MLRKHLPGVLDTAPVADTEKPTNVIISLLQRRDRETWFALHEDYCLTMGVQISKRERERIWHWLDDRYYPLECLMFSIDGRAVGFAIFSQRANLLTGRFDGVVEAIYVAPAMRGRKIGQVALEEIRGIGAYRGWDKITWKVGDKNYAARLLSDRVADNTTINVYLMEVAATEGAA